MWSSRRDTAGTETSQWRGGWFSGDTKYSRRKHSGSRGTSTSRLGRLCDRLTKTSRRPVSPSWPSGSKDSGNSASTHERATTFHTDVSQDSTRYPTKNRIRSSRDTPVPPPGSFCLAVTATAGDGRAVLDDRELYALAEKIGRENPHAATIYIRRESEPHLRRQEMFEEPQGAGGEGAQWRRRPQAGNTLTRARSWNNDEHKSAEPQISTPAPQWVQGQTSHEDTQYTAVAGATYRGGQQSLHSSQQTHQVDITPRLSQDSTDRRYSLLTAASAFPTQLPNVPSQPASSQTPATVLVYHTPPAITASQPSAHPNTAAAPGTSMSPLTAQATNDLTNAYHDLIARGELPPTTSVQTPTSTSAPAPA